MLTISKWFKLFSQDSSSKQMQKTESGAAAMYNDKASVSSVTESHTASQVESETSDVVCPR